MPVIKGSLVAGLIRGMEAFLNYEAGLTRGPVPSSAKVPVAPEADEDHAQLRRALSQTRRRLAQAEENATQLQLALGAADAGLDSAVDPARMVWIFGSGRTGSTWLSRMMEDLPDRHFWNEPLFGKLFGDLYYSMSEVRRASSTFVLADPPEARRACIRGFVSRGIAIRYPAFLEGGHLVLKEPTGSIGAPLLMDALPESRMIFLIRDLRDVMASFMDAQKPGGWMYKKRDERAKATLDNNPDQINLLRRRIKMVAEGISRAKEAHEAHRGPKVLVKYEELLADTLGTMKRIYSALDIPVNESDLARVIEKHSWENVPEEKKGEGKFYRKAASGTWKEDLTPQQVKIVEGTLTPLIKEFYPS